MSENPVLDASELGGFTIDIKNDVFPSWGQSLAPNDVLSTTFEATFTVEDRGLYEQLFAGAPVYTIEIHTDHNPWHRAVSGWRPRLRKLRDGAWWTIRKRILRRPVLDSTKITVPNCRITPSDPPPGAACRAR